MADVYCLNGPLFTLIGEVYFIDNNVNFQIGFSNPGDQEDVHAYEWYLNDTLIVNEESPALAGKLSCGRHKVGVRLLNSEGWSGIKSHTFFTCRIPIALIIEGPDFINEGESATYLVMRKFSDGSVEDLTSDYIFTVSSFGVFKGNVLTTVEDDSSFKDELINITATPVFGEPINKQVGLKNTTQFKSAVLVVDLFDNSSLNVVGFLNNPEVNIHGQMVSSRNNFFPAGEVPENAYMLASDLLPGSSINWRFEFNLAKLITENPDTTDFVMCISGYGNENKVLNGVFSLKTSEAKMTMTGDEGTYLPSVVGGSTTNYTTFTTYVQAEAVGNNSVNGYYNIIRFNYNVLNDILTFTTADQIVISDFDHVAVRYYWDQGAGKDLDIFVGFENTGTPIDGLYVGYGAPNRTIPANTIPQSNAYLWWASDNTSAAGFEAVLIGMEKFLTAYSTTKNTIEVGLYAAWFGVPITGRFTIQLVTYKGGTMELVGTNLVNNGGVQVSNNTIGLHTMNRSKKSTLAEYFKLGILVYNRTTKTAIIDLNPTDGDQ